MAASTGSVTEGEKTTLTCHMCIFPGRKSSPSVLPFNDKTWPRFLQYVAKWRDLEGEQADIARDYISKNAVTDSTPATGSDSHRHSDTTESLLDCDKPIPICAGFHQTCYSRFTDKQRADRVIARMKKREQFAAACCGKCPCILFNLLIRCYIFVVDRQQLSRPYRH